MAKAEVTVERYAPPPPPEKSSAVDGLNLPARFKAFTLQRVDGAWVAVTLHMTNDLDVVKVVASTPDVKAIAMEAFKVAVGKDWMDQESGRA